MLFRSFPGIAQGQKNLDILFQGVDFVYAPMRFKNVEIKLGSDASLREVKQLYDLEIRIGKRLYLLKANTKNHFFIADRASYQVNDLAETSLPVKRENLIDWERLQGLPGTKEQLAYLHSLEDAADEWIEIF